MSNQPTQKHVASAATANFHINPVVEVLVHAAAGALPAATNGAADEVKKQVKALRIQHLRNIAQVRRQQRKSVARDIREALNAGLTAAEAIVSLPLVALGGALKGIGRHFFGGKPAKH
jgi:hypothetical protein